MVDWNGLFKWSLQYNDNTEESKFKKMSDEDRKWLEEALKAYTFDDADRIQSIAQTFEEKYEEIKETELISLLEELEEIFETHHINAVNFHLAGGLKPLVGFMLEHLSSAARCKAL